jgi:hypothetical protein
MADTVICRRQLAEVGEVGESLVITILTCKPSRGLFHGEKTYAHDSCRDELQAEGDLPDGGSGFNMLSDTD